MQNAQNQNNALFNAFVGQADRLKQKGATSADIDRILKFATPAVCEFIAPVLSADIIKSMTNQKAIMRTAQALNFIVTGNGAAFDKATAHIIASIALTTQSVVSFADMRFAMGGTGSENTAAIKGVSREKMKRFIGLISNEGTRVSQCSRTVGKNGFLGVLGATASEGKSAFKVTQRDNPIVIAYAAALEKMTDGALHLVTSK
jgi:IMP cyclohydrolase